MTDPKKVNEEFRKLLESPEAEKAREACSEYTRERLGLKPPWPSADETRAAICSNPLTPVMLSKTSTKAEVMLRLGSVLLEAEHEALLANDNVVTEVDFTEQGWKLVAVRAPIDPEEIDHEYTREIVCPHCGYEHRDSWEISKNEDSDGEMECQRCDKKFLWKCNVSIDYSTEKP